MIKQGVIGGDRKAGEYEARVRDWYPSEKVNPFTAGRQPVSFTLSFVSSIGCAYAARVAINFMLGFIPSLLNSHALTN